ncbi:efflux RND transporter periplasmic adaptor subunit [Raineyella fluvialis]|nr:HlyD family efflux transporter periplasmic adaptor subunit [Raineyella fluvialis]
MAEIPAEGSATTALPPRRLRQRRRRRTIAIVASAVLVVLVVVAVIALMTRNRQSAPTPSSTTYTVQRTSLSRSVTATGTFQPAQQLSVNFPASGTITEVKVAVGDKVTKGQILATEDSAALGATLQSARASVSSAQAQVNSLTSTATTAQVTAAQATLAAAQAKLTQAQSNYDGATLRSPISGIVAKVGVSKGGVATGSSGGSGGSGSASGSQGISAAAAAGLSGTSQSGTNATSATGDVVVVDTSSWQVDTSVGAADLPSLKAGQAVTLTAPDGRTTLAGSVKSVSQVADAASGSSGTSSATFPVVVDVTDTKGTQLYIGSTTTASIVVERLDNVLAVPTSAVSQVNGHPSVRVDTNGTTTDTPVSLGAVVGQETEITGGLSAGDHVLVPTTGFARSSANPSASTSAGAQRGGSGGGGVGGGFFGGNRSGR